jgi:hypothetical protein
LDGQKKIGIKYCGGCNPAYDRVGMINQVHSLFEDRFIVSSREMQDIDILVYVNGCPRACAETVSDQTGVPTRSIVDECDFEKLIDWLTGLEEHGD